MAKVFITSLMLATALAAPMTAKAADHSTLTIGISQYPSTLHPDFDEMVAKSLVLGATQRPVTAYDANWQTICVLCTELPSYENGRAVKETLKDGKKGIAARYTILPDATWGDGTPVTTKDILFAWKVGKHPQSGVGNAEFFAKDIADITVDDDKNFTIHFAKEMCEFAAIGDFYPLPAHLEEKIFDADPVHYQNKTLYITDPTNKGLYWGPYTVSKTESGAAVTLEKNPQWKGKAPAFDKVVFRTIENSSALSANLLSGGIDYIAGELGLSLDQALALEKRLPQGKYNVTYKPGLTFEHIDLNLSKKTFADVRVRKALMYAMDREAINNLIYSGKQPVAKTDINPLDSIFTDAVTTYPHDPAKAAALLDEAGWHLKDDGLRYNAAGEKLSLAFSTTAGNKTRETIQQAIQSDWKKAGIDAVIKNEPARVLFGDTMRERRFEGGVMYAWMSSPKNIPKTTLYSAMIPSKDNNYAGQNYPGYNNPKMDKIIDDLQIVCTPAENTALWHDLQVLYADELPALPLYYRADPFFIPVWLDGIVPTGHLNPTTMTIENWSVKP